MRRLGLLAALVPLACIAPLAGCTQENPEFDQADDTGTTDRPGDGDGDPTTGDGDGDPTTGDGDGDPTGDGDGDPTTGDGDGDPTGDGDGDPTGDGDGDLTGDGDGDGDIPACPDYAWVDIPLAQDTFLDATPAANQGCQTDWIYDQNTAELANVPCAGLDFGATTQHWACGGGGECNSTWLGRFDVANWPAPGVMVAEAGVEFTAKIQNAEPAQAWLWVLDTPVEQFGECGDWLAGPGHGDPPADCVTTYIHSAYPYLWNALSLDTLDPNTSKTMANLPAFADEPVDHMFAMTLEPLLVQNWLSGEAPHQGLLLRTNAWLPKELNLYAQGSDHPPVLSVKVCAP